MLALGMARVGMESSRARRTRSVWVVALVGVRYLFLKGLDGGREGVAPEWISYDEERDVDFVGVFEDVVAGRFDHFAVGYDDFAAIERLLLS